jgi:hypothetical protein
MTRKQLVQAYEESWKQFYTVDHMKRALKRFEGSTYWSLFLMFMWYTHSAALGEHPMLGGFWRKRERKDRRAGFKVEGALRHRWSMLKYTVKQLRLWWTMLPVLQEVWLGTRKPDPNEGRIGAIVKGALSFRPTVTMHNLAARFNRMRVTRQDLSAYWRSFKRFAWHRANPLAAPWKALREWALLVHFLIQLRRGTSGTAG